MRPSDITPAQTAPHSGAAGEAVPPTPSLAPATDAAVQEAGRLGELIRQRWAQGAAAAQARIEAATMSQRSQRYVREQPLKSVLFAAAAGAALTGLFTLRRSRGH